MGWFFRKSIKVFPGVRLNIGKKGITSATVGKGGWFSTNIGQKGVKHNFNVPGTGLRYQTKPVSFLQSSQSPTSPTAGVPFWPCSSCGSLNTDEQSRHCEQCHHFNASPAWTYRPVENTSMPSSKGPLMIVGIILAIVVGISGLCAIAIVSKGPFAVQPGEQRTAVPVVNPTAVPSPNIVKNPSKNLRATPLIQRQTQPARTKTDSSGIYHLGSRGGCYYLNGSGNKTYVDHSLCG